MPSNLNISPLHPRASAGPTVIAPLSSESNSTSRIRRTGIVSPALQLGKKSPSTGTQALSKSANSPVSVTSSKRQKSLVRPERSRSKRSLSTRIRRNAITGLDEAGHDWSDEDSNGPRKKQPLQGCCKTFKIWESLARCCTCWVCDCCLIKCGGRHDPVIRQAWREKAALCLIIFVSCLALGFLTFGLSTVVCRPPKSIYRRSDVAKKIGGNNRWFIIHGYIYNIPDKYSPYDHATSPYAAFAGKDITTFFPYNPSCIKAGFTFQLSCKKGGFEFCHSTDLIKHMDRVGQVTWDWSEIENSKNHLVYNGVVLDVSSYLEQVPSTSRIVPYGFDVDFIFRNSGGGDATKAISALPPMTRRCLLENFGAGTVDIKSVGCILTDVILYVSLVAILAVIIVKFILAVFFTVFFSRKMCDFQAKKDARLKKSQTNSVAHCDSDKETFSSTVGKKSKKSGKHSDKASTTDRGRRVSRKLDGDLENCFSDCPVSDGFDFNMSADGLSDGYLSASSNSLQTKSRGKQSRYSAALKKKYLPRASFSGSFNSLGLNSSGDELGPSSEPTDDASKRHSIRRVSLHQLPSMNDVLTSDPTPYEPATKDLSTSIIRLDSQVDPDVMHTILVITCYSEGEEGLRATIESLVETEYPDDQKLLFIVADGLIHGSGEAKSTPEILIDLCEVDPYAGYINGKPWSDGLQEDLKADGGPPSAKPGDEYSKEPRKRMTTAYNEEMLEPSDPSWLPKAYSYVAIADGKKRHNMARIFAGHYSSKGHRVPALVVVKCGTPEEATTAKPGNRGKRDSQIILMAFLSKVLFHDRMTPLEYDMFIKIRSLMNITPDLFEVTLCVDADTRVDPNCLAHMTAVMKMDPQVMGLCGETKISNKNQSWVTLIQVFEYFISHHLNKAFESIFGGVTCLPGCFCMYRIKAPKVIYHGHWVPILASPDIVNFYAENVTDTLHKKNLLLLGEDRYLSTLLLKTFPKRKMVFVPMATCKTLVPDTFQVLLSQRRRWINSTVHNLFELVLVNDLCGTFCCSMQFVIFMELVGTLVLPAAIIFTGVLLASSFWGPVQYIPLGLLVAILGLPAFLILFTTRSPVYVIYMICYLVSLPIWNFVLPTYAFWHFDDFSWGQTRQVSGASSKDVHGEKDGEFDADKIMMKYWYEYEDHWSRSLKG